MLYMNGYESKPQDRPDVEIKNPYNGEVVGTMFKAAPGDGEGILKAAEAGFAEWSAMTLAQRTEILMKYVALLGENKDRLGLLLSKEMGKIYGEAMGEAVGTANISKGFIQRANHLYGRVISANQPGIEQDLIFTRREPLGIMLCIVPFNFPLELYAHKVIPALIMGNAVIIKVPQYNPLALTEMTKLLVEAGVPAGAAQVVYGGRDVVTEELIKSDRIQAVSLTGSTAAGIAIQQDSAPFLHKVFLELGGNDALIICEDADPDEAVENIYWGRVFNVGQTCCASKRFLVHSSIKDEVVKKLIARLEGVKRGDPTDPATEYGVMHAAGSAQVVMDQIESIKAQGAKCVYGGTIKNGTWLEPTVLVDVTKDMDVAKDLEVFGPVIPIISFDTIEEAIEITNNTQYGLSCGIVSKNLARSINMATKIKAGAVVTNATGNFRHMDQAFGGFKKSGIGREGVSATLEEFSQEKSYIVRGVL